MRLSRDHITTLRQTRLGIPRATRCTAIRIPRCKLPGQPERVARHLAADAAAAASEATAAEERHLRGIAAEESEEAEVPAQANSRDARRRGALDAGVAETLDGPRQAGIRHLNCARVISILKPAQCTSFGNRSLALVAPAPLTDLWYGPRWCSRLLADEATGRTCCCETR
ncbi:hypothetical protein KM043_016810 [Ampulex compressa]|nr:hypothetical protein KM043_016810 [Ampulex compressa]